MKEEQVPNELADLLGEKLYDDAHEGCDEGGCSGGGRPFYNEYARALLIEVLPVHERMIRKQVSQDVLDRGIPAALAPELEQLIREKVITEAVSVLQQMREDGETDLRQAISSLRDIARGEQR